jgi:hypothetical protein
MKRQIDVKIEVFHLIWSNWRHGDTDENSILERLLSTGSSVHLRESGEQSEAASAQIDRAKEENTYRNGGVVPMSGNSVGLLKSIGKIRWVDDVRSALIGLGGEGDLSQIYRAVREIRSEAGRRIVESLEATIRQSLEAYSSDSENFKEGNADYFHHISRGRWGLRR